MQQNWVYFLQLTTRWDKITFLLQICIISLKKGESISFSKNKLAKKIEEINKKLQNYSQNDALHGAVP